MFLREKEIIALIHRHSKNVAGGSVITDPNAIQKSIGLQKGDLIVFQASETPVRLPVGSNDYLLVADSSQTMGLAYKQLTANNPLALTNFVLSLNYNSTNLKITSNALNTIQDIATNSTPTFTQVTLTNPGTTTQAVRGDRQISTNAPLTGGGDLSTNRTLGLSYNTTNLKLTSNVLNTIQDIATTSSPTFANLTINGVLQGNLPSNGLANRISNFTVLPNGFLEYHFNFRFEQDQLRFANLRPDLFTITYSNDFTADEINRLFSVYASNINLYGKSENCWIMVECSPGTIGDSPSYPYVLLHANNNPVTVKIEVQHTGNPGVWQTAFDGTGNYVVGGFLGGIGQVTKIKWTFYNILNPTYVRWIGHLVQRMTSYRHTILRYGDTIYGDLLFYNNSKIGSGDNNTFKICANNTNILYLTPTSMVGINQSSPVYTLDVTGTGRFTQDLRLESLLKQIGTTGVNEFNTDVEQKGNKSFYSSFTSGWTGSGWRIDYGVTDSGYSHLELDNLTVRGAMRVYELIINQIKATNGSLFISSSAKVLNRTLTPGDPETYTIVFEDPEGLQITPFAVNDILIVQRVRLDSTTVVKKIVLQVTSINQTTVTASVIYRLGAIEKGDLAVRIGNTTSTNRQGSVYLTSDDSNAPYIDIVDGVNSWSAWGSQNKIKVRLGRISGITHPLFGTIGSNIYGMFAKGNLYLSSEDTTNNLITLRADTNAGLLVGVNFNGANPLYISVGRIYISQSAGYSNNYGFGLKDESGNDFLELSTNRKHIAGWDFTQEKFFKSTDIELNSTSKSVGVNSNKVKIFYTNSSTWGVEGRDASNNLVFQLGSTNKICGWNFDTVKFSNDVVSLEASSSMKGLVVDTDKIKVGKFDYGTMSNSYSDITTTVLNGYSGINPSDGYWGILGNYWINNNPYTPGITVFSNYLNSTINTEVETWDYRITHRLFGHDTHILGKKIRHRVKIHFTLGVEQLAFSGGHFQLAIRYYNSSFGTTYRQVIYEENIDDNLTETYTIDFSSGIEITLPADIPNTAYVYIEYCFSGGAQYGNYFPYDMDLSDFYIDGYLNFKTWINEKGIYLYNSPMNFVKLFDSSAEISVPTVKVRGKKVVRFFGIQGSAPTEDVELGDLYIRSSDKKVLICNEINNNGVPQWSVIN